VLEQVLEQVPERVLEQLPEQMLDLALGRSRLPA
jgi:hypothetical protein